MKTFFKTLLLFQLLIVFWFLSGCSVTYNRTTNLECSVNDSPVDLSGADL